MILLLTTFFCLTVACGRPHKGSDSSSSGGAQSGDGTHADPADAVPPVRLMQGSESASVVPEDELTQQRYRLNQVGQDWAFDSTIVYPQAPPVSGVTGPQFLPLYLVLEDRVLGGEPSSALYTHIVHTLTNGDQSDGRRVNVSRDPDTGVWFVPFAEFLGPDPSRVDTGSRHDLAFEVVLRTGVEVSFRVQLRVITPVPSLGITRHLVEAAQPGSDVLAQDQVHNEGQRPLKFWIQPPSFQFSQVRRERSWASTGQALGGKVQVSPSDRYYGSIVPSEVGSISLVQQDGSVSLNTPVADRNSWIEIEIPAGFVGSLLYHWQGQPNHCALRGPTSQTVTGTQVRFVLCSRNEPCGGNSNIQIVTNQVTDTDEVTQRMFEMTDPGKIWIGDLSATVAAIDGSQTDGLVAPVDPSSLGAAPVGQAKPSDVSPDPCQGIY